MNPRSERSASIPNPLLSVFGVLIGKWNTSGTHPLVPDTVVHGRVTFEWLDNGAFLLMRSEVDDDRFPNGLSILGSDDALQAFTMLYFDSRSVSRRYEVSFDGQTWKVWRDAPGFSQRFTGTLSNGGNSLIGKWEVSRDDATWQDDLQIYYERAG